MEYNHESLSKAILVNLSIAFIFFIIVLPPIILNIDNPTEAYDQNVGHLPLVKSFVMHPLSFRANYEHSEVAMTPGHHLLLSWVAKICSKGQVNPQTLSIRIANAFFGLALILTVWWLCYLKTASISQSVFLTTPLLFSSYILKSSIWVFTDNGALFWTCATLLVLSRPFLGSGRLLLAGILTGMTILWRQIYIWLLAPLLLRGIEYIKNTKRWYILLLALSMPLGVLTAFLVLWGGIIPPGVRDAYHKSSPNFIIFVYITSLFGFLGIFFVGYIWERILRMTSQSFFLILTIVVIGLSLSALVPSNYDYDSGRWGGTLWSMARVLPVFYNRSIVFLMLCPLGLLFFYFWSNNSFDQSNKLVLISLLSWLAINLFNSYVFQRYYEPMLLIFFALLVSNAPSYSKEAPLGPVLLSIILFATSILKIYF